MIQVLPPSILLALPLICAPAWLTAQEQAESRPSRDEKPRSAKVVDPSWRQGRFARARMRNIDLRGAQILGEDLRRSDLRHSQMEGIRLWRSRIDGADLRGAQGLGLKQVVEARWDPQDPPHLDVALNRGRAFWDRGRMEGEDLRGAVLWGRDLRGFEFEGCRLQRAVLIAADLRGALFEDAELSGALLVGARLDRADLRGVNGLSPATLLSAVWEAGQPPRVARPMLPWMNEYAARRMPGRDLRGVQWWGRDLRRFNLTGADLRGARLVGCKLQGAVLADAQLAGADLGGADLSDADLLGAKGLQAAQLLSARWQPGREPRVDDRLSLFIRQLAKRSLATRDLQGVDFSGRDLQEQNFNGADLSGAVFWNSRLVGALLRNADLRGAVFVGADLSRCDLRGAKGFGPRQLLSARWDPAQPPRLGDRLEVWRRRWEAGRFIGETLGAADLRGANLRGMRASRADLRAANLDLAQLKLCNLSEADLRGVSLVQADLTSADLRGAKGLTPAMLAGARWLPSRPPALLQGLAAIRSRFDSRVFDVSLAGAEICGRDPEGSFVSRGRGTLLAAFQLSNPPRVGLVRLCAALRGEGRLVMRLYDTGRPGSGR